MSDVETFKRRVSKPFRNKKKEETFRGSNDDSNGGSNDDSNSDDFPSMATDLIRKVNWKIALFLFALMVFVFSDVFMELTLNSFDGAIEGDCPTTKGTVIQIIVVILSYIVLDLLAQGGIL
jgi:hypothetical protein